MFLKSKILILNSNKGGHMIKQYKKIYKSILNEIIKYDTIAVYRHTSPDFDASGTQNGLVTWLKDSFPNKKIYPLGKDFIDFTPRLYPHIEEVSLDNQDFLAIILDTGNTERIDNQSFKNAKSIVRFDHHPKVETIGNIELVDDSLASCSELVLDFISCFIKKYPLSPLAAKYFYSGIVGDSGRFLFSSVNIHTFEMAELCLKTGININKDVYLPMYEKDFHDLEIQQYLLNHYVLTDKGVAYYVLKDQDLKELNLRTEQGKNYMSMFSNIKGINCWVAISEDKEKGEFRVSLRSKEKAINKVAEMFRGGGHAQASGAKLSSLDELPSLIEELNKLF